MFAWNGIKLAAGISISLTATLRAILGKERRYCKANVMQPSQPILPNTFIQIIERSKITLAVLALLTVLSITQSHAQSSIHTEPESAPLPTPSMTGPLKMSPPILIHAEPFGTVEITGILSGFGYWQSYPENNNSADRLDISNGALFMQKTKGLIQFFVQAGAYNLPALGSSISSTATTIDNDFGPLPVVFVKVSPNDKLSFLAGKLPTLMGMENTFTFQNFDIERGLLWNQTNAVTRGIQVNYTGTALSNSFSWNDGFYSDRYNWITDTEAYTINKSNALTLSAGDNLGLTGYSTPSTPLYQNNSSYVDIAYTYTSKQWMIEPYFQFTRVHSNRRIEVPRATDTLGSAIFTTYSLCPDFSLVGRAEFIGSTGSQTDTSINLINGSGSKAWSLTITPTYQNHAFFARPEFSVVHTLDTVQGDSFGTHGNNLTQTRFMLETGIIF